MTFTDKMLRHEVAQAKRNIRKACKGCGPVDFKGWEIRLPAHGGYPVLVILYTSDAGSEEYRIAI